MPDDTSSPGTDATRSTGWWSRLFLGRGDDLKGREEIAAFLVECRRNDLLAQDEYNMLQGVLDVSETHVRDIMVPRSHMVVLEHDDPSEVQLKTIVESGHSRFPVIGEDRDEVRGILLAKDLLKQFAEGQCAFDIAGMIRPAVFIPESKRLNTLLTEFRESQNHIAIVVDEYGGVSGLATIEDVLEQIVGEIDDEHDPEEVDDIQDQRDGHFQALALTRIEDFNDYFRVELSDEDYDTLGGLVMHELGRLPRRGEQLEFGGFVFRVLRADRRRIHTLDVVRVASAAAG